MAISCKEFIKILQSGKKPVVQFEEAVEEMESIFDEGMRGRAVSFVEQPDGLVKFTFEVKEFEAYNIPHMKPNYCDKDGNATLKAIETRYYPKDGLEDIYYGREDDLPWFIVKENGLVAEYTASGSKEPYVLWLEKRLVKHQEAWTELKESLEKDIPVLEDLKKEKSQEEVIRLNGKIEGVKHAIERIRTTGILYSIKE
jgi:hypothetical protein